MPIKSGMRIAERYRVERLLGEGAAATVWLATDERLGRHVALKVYRADGEVGDDFLHEARAVATLNHPTIVTVHDVVETPDHVFIVMEYVEGTDLKTHLAQHGPLDVQSAIELLLQISRAVAAAHAAGLLHRDLKPGNVLITPDGQVKVTDFGIAQRQDTSSAEHDDVIRGTPAYLSPEQAVGRPLTPASDVYSLGILFFELLTGRRPFEADNPRELAYAHVNAVLPDVTDYNPLVPAGVAHFLDTMLAKAPDERPSDAEQVVAWLRRYLDTSQSQTQAMPPVVEAPASESAVAPPSGMSPPTTSRFAWWPWGAAGAVLLALFALCVAGFIALLGMPPDLIAGLPASSPSPEENIGVVATATATSATVVPATPTSTPAPTQTLVPTSTPAPTQTSIPTSTPTPLPPSPTAIPTQTPVPQPPASRLLTVKKAEYNEQQSELKLEIDSDRAAPFIDIYVTETGERIGQLENEHPGRGDKGKYKGDFEWPTYPEEITVQTSEGDSVTAAVKRAR